MLLKGLQKPKRLECDKDTLTKTYGKFVAEPFERGFGITIGNALRRTLMSAIPGAAVTAIQVNGVYHEFSSVPGVVEDIADIILNLKLLRLRIYGDEPKVIRINAQNASGEFKAKDIVTDANVEIFNPDLHIATLDENATFEAELTVERGRGYVTAEDNKKEGQPLGVIPIDSIFSPIQKVNFWVENTFLGESKAYDRLNIEVWTDGTIGPEDAIACAAKILKDQWSIFTSVEQKLEEAVVEDNSDDDYWNKLNEFLDRSVNELELSVRAYNCLKNANIKTIRDLVQKSDNEMLRTKNFGRKSLNEIKEILMEMDLTLGTDLDELIGKRKKKKESLC
ncbi:MAG: DNA-directed RNA polymerase subunit alpha [Candidatus Schekmanbacteria bacterium]|nr:DNA-directed RNA polymerase subunit alpha [Candidatus Schekmanbacteria bacterium]